MKHILYNPKANNGCGELEARNFGKELLDVDYLSVLEIQEMKAFFEGLPTEDTVILSGGDGTLNHFVNDLRGYTPKNQIYYVKTGSGNDFFRDAEKAVENGWIHLNRYMGNLPVIKVGDVERVFINGIGYGIDGETCLIGDRLRETSDKPVNYSSIAVKLLLSSYKKNNATIEVDGKTATYENVWFASTMKGRFYGGGMMVAPQQDRFNQNGTVSVVCLHKRSRLITLMRFTSLFKGEHVKWSDWCNIVEGKQVKITFEYPCALQIDGEVIPDVLSYTVQA